MHHSFNGCFRLWFVMLTAFCGCAQAQQQMENSSGSEAAFSVSGFYYYVPQDNNLLAFTGNAQFHSLYFEGRYNYEDLHTGSVFGGWRFETEGRIGFAATPMIGVVFGKTNAAAPALELEAALGRLNFYSETEYVIEFSGRQKNFLYTWSELGFQLLSSLEVGISVQRSLLYKTGFELQRGFMAKYFLKKFRIAGYYFNPFSSNNVVVVSLSREF